MALSKGFVTTAATTALDGRLLEQGLLTKNVGDVPRAGLLYGDIAPVKATSATAPMTVSIADQTVFAVSRGNSDGVSIISNVGLATVQLAAAPSANSRYDVIYAKQNDTEKGDSNSNPVFDKVTGQAGASPVVPAAPAGALVLATVLIPAGVTATTASGVVITNSVLSTSLAGTPIRYRSTAEMTTDTPNVVEGTSAFIKGGGNYYLRSGTWRREDANPIVIVSQTTGTPISSGTAAGTIGGTNPTYQTMDTAYFPQRNDGVIGPIAVAGWYEVTAAVGWSNNSTGQRYIEVMPNDSGLTPALADQRAASGTTNQTVTGQMYLNVGDLIKLKAWQNSGGSINYQSRLVAKPLYV